MASSPFNRLLASLRGRRVHPIRKTRRLRPFAVELLEDRVVPANHVWIGAVNGNWNNASNWADGIIPGAGGETGITMSFGDIIGTKAMTDDIAGLKVDSIAFSSTGYSLAGTANTFTLSGAVPQAIFDSVGGNTISGSMVLGSNNDVQINVAAGVDTISAAISDVAGNTGGIVKTGSGTLVLRGTSTYVGLTTLNNGVVQLGANITGSNSGPLGTTAGATIINAGATLDLNGFTMTGSTAVEPITMSGTGFNGKGAITNTASNVSPASVVAGALTLAGNTTIVANNGLLAVGGTLSTATFTISGFRLTLDGTATNATLTGALGGTGSVTKIGTGTWTFAGSLASYSGGTTVVAGTAKAGTAGTVPNGPFGSTAVGIVVNSGAALDLGSANIGNAYPLTISGTGVGGTGALTNSSATAVTYLGPITTSADSLVGAGLGKITLAGRISATAGTLKLGNLGLLANAAGSIANFVGIDKSAIVGSGATLDLNGQANATKAINIAGTGVGGNGALINSSVTPASISASGSLADLFLSSGGSGYSVPPTVTITDVVPGGGSGATASALLGLSSSSFSLTSGTEQFFAPPPIVISGGGAATAGTATAVATLDSNGVVSGITITSPGAGYTTAPTLTFTILPANVKTSGTLPAATGNATNFIVSELLLTAAGSGYTPATSVTISGASTTTAAATALPTLVNLTAPASIGGAGNLTIPIVTGAFGLTKVGTGVLTLTGASTYLGPTTVSAGALIVNGSLAAASTVTVASGATLGGTGIVNGAVTDNGIINPAIAGTTGTLTLSGGVTFGPSSALNIDVSGAAADEAVVTGKPDLSSLTLNVTGLSPTATSYTILHATPGTTGQFLNAPGGSTIVVGGQAYIVSYTGSDVILTLPSPPIFTSASATTFLTGVGGTFPLSATGSGPITFSDAAGDVLPPGMTLANGVLSGTPTALGVYTLHLTATNSAGPTTQTLTVTVDPALLVTSTFDSALYAIDAHTGALVKTLVASNTSQDLIGPAGAVLGPDGNLYVSSQGAVVVIQGQAVLVGDKILQINPGTGAVNVFLDTSVLDQVAGIPSGGHFFPAGLAFGPDGNLYVSQNGGQASSSGEVVRFDVTSTGGVLSVDQDPAHAVVVAAFGSTTELIQPAGLVFGIAQGDTNNLYVANSPLGEVDKIVGATGPTPVLTTFVAAGAGQGATYVIPGQNPGDPPLTETYPGLSFPAGLAFGPDGKLYVSDLAALNNDGDILRINSDGSVDSAVFAQMNLGSQQGSLHNQFPYGLQFDDQGNLLTADLGKDQNVPLPGTINEYAPNGVFLKTLVSPASFPIGIAPGTAILDMPRQTTVYVASDNFGLAGTLTYGEAIPASAETGGQPAVYGVSAFSSITAALAAVSTSGAVDVSAGTYHEAVTLIGAETLKLLGDVSVNSFIANAGTTLSLNGFTLSTGPTFTSPSATTQLTGVGNTFAAIATALGNAGTITYSENPSDILPPGMTFSTSTGVLSGTPTALGVYTLHLTATNAITSVNQTLTVTVDPALLVTSTFDSALYAIDAHTGALVKTLVASNTSQDLIGPAGAVLGPDGNLYVSSQGAVVVIQGQAVLVGDKILQINPGTGAVNVFLDTSVLDQVAGVPSGGHFFPAGLAFGPDGNLYVSQNGGQASSSGEVVRFDVTSTGGVLSVDQDPAHAVVVAAFGSTTELIQPAGLVFGIAQGDTNNLYVANSPLGEVDKIVGATGPTPILTTFVAAGAGQGATYVIPGQNPGDPPLTETYPGLSFPAGLAFGPDGKLYVSDLAALNNDGDILRINSDGSVDSAVFAQMNLGSQQGSLHNQFPYGLQFDDQGNLLTADLGENQNVPLPGTINEYAPNGVFLKTLVSPASFPIGIAPGTAILDMPRQSTVYVASDNFGLAGTLTYGEAIPASAETGGQPAVYGVSAFSSITAALAAVSTSGAVDVSAGTYHEAVTLIGAETLKLLGDVSVNSFIANAGTTLSLNGFTLSTGPTFTSPSATTQLTGVGNTFAAIATALGNAGTITYSENPSDILPPGMTFSTSTGVLSGTPTALGVYTLHLTATNAITSVNQTLTVTVDPALLVTSTFDSALYAIDAHTGALVKTLVASNTSQDLIGPAGAVLGPDGNLYVSSQGAVVVIQGQAVLVGDKILQINPGTGAVNVFLDTSVLDQVAGIPSGGHFFPAGLAFGPDGNLYVSQNGGQASSSGEVVRFGVTSTGSVLSADQDPAHAVVVAAFGSTTELIQPAGLVFGIAQGDTNNLYVANSPLGEVDKIVGATGPTPILTTFVAAGAGQGATYVIPGQNPGDPPLTETYPGLSFPAGLAFGPDGKLYVSDLAALNNDGDILRINSDGSVDSAVFAQMNLGSQQGSLHNQFPYGLQFDDQGNLLTADLGENQNVPLPGTINEYAPNGVFLKTLVSPASFPIGIAPGTAILDMPRQTTVYVASDNFGLAGTLTYGEAIPASAETGGQPAVYGVSAFSSITAALAAVSTAGTVDINAGTYHEAVTLIGAETLRMLGNVTIDSINTSLGTTIDLEGNTLTTGSSAMPENVAGLIKGAGGNLVKVGTGALTLGGADTYTGTTTVSAGALIVNGSISASSNLSVSASAILGGTGSVGNLINNGVVNPGSPGVPGSLTIAGNLTFGPGTLVLDLAAKGSDSINDTGPTIDITGTTLALNVGEITPGETFTILVTPGDITGRFANLPTTGSSFVVGSITFTIDYDAGVGNDATVTLHAGGNVPSLVGTVLNGGNAYIDSTLATHQHSMVESVVYSFTQPVSLTASNFTLSGFQGTPASLVPNVNVSGSGTTWTVTFSGVGVNDATHSIGDGEYELVLSGVAGMANSTYDFFRLLGDMDGDGTVSASDFSTLISTFLRPTTDPLYLGADDFDGDGSISASDLSQFTTNFLHTVPAPLPN